MYLRNWDRRKKEAEVVLETYVTFTATANKFITVRSIHIV